MGEGEGGGTGEKKYRQRRTPSFLMVPMGLTASALLALVLVLVPARLSETDRRAEAERRRDSLRRRPLLSGRLAVPVSPTDRLLSDRRRLRLLLSDQRLSSQRHSPRWSVPPAPRSWLW